MTVQELSKILFEVLFPVFTLDTPYEGTRDHRARLRIFTSRMVGRYINALELEETEDKGLEVKIGDDYKKEIAILKQTHLVLCN